jgi:hypothetical protein
VLKSPNLPSLYIHVNQLSLSVSEKVSRGDEDPGVLVWLKAVLEATPPLHEPLESNTVLSQLNSLHLNQVKFSVDLFWVFYIPSLRFLNLASCGFDSDTSHSQIRPQDWPI